MDNVQLATPVAPATPGKAAATDAAGDAQSLPWVSALQAALSLQGKVLKPLSAQGADTTDSAAPATDVSASDDKELNATDGAGAALPVDLSLPLLAALVPAPPVPVAAVPVAAVPAAATPPASALPPGRADPLKAPGADGLAMPVGTGPAQPGTPINAPGAPLRDVVKVPVTANPSAGNDELTRTIEQFTARDAAGRETPALPQATQAALSMLAQQAMPSTTPAAPPAAQLQVNAVVGTAAWDAELGQQVVWMVGEKQQVAELRVNPPDLGPLDIKITIGEHETTAVFTSPHGAVRDAVESALPRLREVLAESGITLGNASVTADSPRDGSAFAQSREHMPRGEHQAGADPSVSARALIGNDVRMHGNGLVDLFA